MSISKEQVNREYSFMMGWKQVPVGDAKKVRTAIMAALNVNRSNFYRRLKGLVVPRVDEKEAIDKIFKDYKITSNIWGGETNGTEC